MNKKIISVLVLILISTAALHLTARPGHSNYDVSAGVDLGDFDYKDGVYQGTATGFGTGLTVEIEIKNGELKSVKVIEHNEVGQNFWYKPLTMIPKVIVKEQSTDVDTVAGATASSEGLLSAVENALEKARIE